MTQWQGRWTIWCLSSIWIIWFFGPVLWHPDDYLMGTTGDGLKNYFTFAYHVRHDTSWIAFNGCNYPFKDHVNYTDGHPILSLLFGQLSIVKNHPVGFLNLFMISGFLVGSWLLYEWLLLWKIQPVVAVIGAFLIHLGHPQLDRLLGHLSLAAVWAVPAMIYLLERWRLQGGKRFLILAYLVCLFLWLLHPYLGLMANSLLLIFPLITRFVLNEKVNDWKWSSFLGLLAILQFFLFVKWTDHHPDRPDGGAGFLQYLTSFEALFGGLDGNAIEWLFGPSHLKEGHYEGQAYLGFIPIIVWLSAGILAIWKLRCSGWRNAEGHSKLHWWVTALLFLIFACGIPFIWGLQDVLPHLPFLNHFRCPGRFVWVFYFVFSASAFCFLQFLLDQNRGWTLAVSVLLLLIGILDHGQRQIRVHNHMGMHPNVFNPHFIEPADIAYIERIKNHSTKTDAIWTIPQICYGSDFYTRSFDAELMKRAYVVSYHTGIPLFGTMNPRASYSESRAYLQMTAKNIFYKDMWKLLQDSTNFYILPLGNPLWQDEERLVPFANNWRTIAQEKEEFARLQWKANEQEQLLVLPESEDRFDASGRLILSQPEYHLVKKWRTDHLDTSEIWSAQAWLYFKEPLCNGVRWAIEEKDTNNVMRRIAQLDATQGSYQFYRATWLQTSFEVKPNCEYLILLEHLLKDEPEIEMKNFKLLKIDDGNSVGVPNFTVEPGGF
jgi:hypothetical protein